MIQRFIFLFFLACTLGLHPSVHAESTATTSPTQTAVFATTPTLKPDGSRWRVGYVESGDYPDYVETLSATIKGLERLEWLSLTDQIPQNTTGHEMWQWLATHTVSPYVQFVDEAFWHPGNFDASKREAMRQAISERLQTRHDIDLIIAMGTWAGQDMRTLGPPVPTVVGSTSDPVAAGITDSPQDSGRENLHARVEPERYQRQLRLFHEIMPFKTLGVVYEDSPEGRTYAAVPAIKEISKALGFEVEYCNAPSNSIPLEAAINNAVRCYQTLAKSDVDAVYVTTHRGVTATSVVQIADALKKAKIPSFSMAGSEQVEAGLLLSLARAQPAHVALFYAETIARIFNGARPRQLSQLWIDPPKIALNLKTTRIIGFNPPVDILLAADEVYGADQ
ncbi:hypothetical protein KVP09_14290 [Alcaligenaceae bacterium CGII-47]|nr:hypothetical protein [Alcaligenaceae bacterium CGII-47]